jgi:predicted DNA-binding transcriptional regulator AlpA
MQTDSVPASIPMRHQPLLLKAAEAAALCAASEATWWRWNASGRCPRPVRCGGITRWRASDVRLWVALGLPDRRTFEAHLAAKSNGTQGK